MSALTVLQLMTKAGWPEVMAVAKARFGAMILIYVYPLLFIGELIVLNMTSSVVIVCFSNRSHVDLESSSALRGHRQAGFGLDPLKLRDKVIEAVRKQTRQIMIANTTDLNWRVRSDAVQVRNVACLCIGIEQSTHWQVLHICTYTAQMRAHTGLHQNDNKRARRSARSVTRAMRRSSMCSASR